MDDTAKYLIHAAITADGVVERSDVVGAIFGQTEGLLGDDLDLRDLQQSSKVGRIDVQIQSQNGQSYGEVTIASSLDKVETSILAASLETISRVGPCRATVEVTDIEDVRAAKRRDVVERAKELLADSFDDSVMTSHEILEEVREAVRIEDITEYHGYPAGPNVESSEAIIIVEGRADVLTLLRYGIKNAIAVEGTNVPESVAELTQERHVTTFFDGDRGGELILRELAQVGNVDYAAFAPRGRSVEDLTRQEVMSSLRDKVPYETFLDKPDAGQTVTATDGSTKPAPEDTTDPRTESSATTESPATPTPTVESETTERSSLVESDEYDERNERDEHDEREERGERDDSSDETDADEVTDAAEKTDADETTTVSDSPDERSAGDSTTPPSPTLRDHIRDVIEAETGTVRLLDDSLEALSDAPADDAFDAVAETADDRVPYALVLDGEASQRIVDIAAQRGVEHVVARSSGELVKKPISVRLRTASQILQH